MIKKETLTQETYQTRCSKMRRTLFLKQRNMFISVRWGGRRIRYPLMELSISTCLLTKRNGWWLSVLYITKKNVYTSFDTSKGNQTFSITKEIIYRYKFEGSCGCYIIFNPSTTLVLGVWTFTWISTLNYLTCNDISLKVLTLA